MDIYRTKLETAKDALQELAEVAGPLGVRELEEGRSKTGRKLLKRAADALGNVETIDKELDLMAGSSRPLPGQVSFPFMSNRAGGVEGESDFP